MGENMEENVGTVEGEKKVKRGRKKKEVSEIVSPESPKVRKPREVMGADVYKEIFDEFASVSYWHRSCVSIFENMEYDSTAAISLRKLEKAIASARAFRKGMKTTSVLLKVFDEEVDEMESDLEGFWEDFEGSNSDS